MNLNLFVPGDRVAIPELEAQGVVIETNMAMRGTTFKIRYFHDGMLCEADLYDFEIAPIKQESPLIRNGATQRPKT